MSRLLIVTADDFGAHPAINAAIAEASQRGILTAASLMVAAPAAAEAVALARALPGLQVGLHLVLTDGTAALPPLDLPDLVDPAGRFRHSMVTDAFRIVAVRRILKQAAAEIRAQFEAFRATGLVLDHVNAHKHFHIHPVLLRLMLDIGADYGLRAVRLPREPMGFAAGMGATAALSCLMMKPWLATMRRVLLRRGIAFNDWGLGLSCTGRWDEQTLHRVLLRLPDRSCEIYLHPCLEAGLPAPGYRGDGELRALLSARVREALEQAGIRLGSFRDLPLAQAGESPLLHTPSTAAMASMGAPTRRP